MAPSAHALKQQFDRKTLSLCRLVEAHSESPGFGSILVVGCGDGREAATLAGRFGARTTGIDIADSFDAEAKKTVDLRVMDATDLDFPGAAFDLVYSFHALEHIPDDRGALREMNRVLKPDGLVCIGAPNRRRLVGYVGSATDIGTKIRWNLADLKMRMQGRFRNECGAHAGYARAELTAWCAETFGHAVDITDQYYLEIYKNKRNLIRFIIGAKLHNLLFPCVYVLAGKKGFDKS